MKKGHSGFPNNNYQFRPH